MLKAKTLQVAGDLDFPEGVFTASSNWIKRFLRRHRLSFRYRTQQWQTTPPDAEQARSEFCEYVCSLKVKHNVSVVHDADQTAVCYEYVPSETIDNTGTKTVWVKCAGRTIDRITLMLLADSDGNKYMSYAIFKRKDADTSEMRKENNERRHGFGKRLWEDVRLLQEKHDVQIYGNQTAWWNSDMSILFLDYYFGNRANPEQKILLLWDDFSGHWTPEVKAKAEELNVVLVKVPPKYTYVCQPADVSWNKPLKDRLRRSWVESLQKQLLERDQGKPFRVKPPSRAELFRWVNDAWTTLSDRTITSGFSKVGLVTS